MDATHFVLLAFGIGLVFSLAKAKGRSSDQFGKKHDTLAELIRQKALQAKDAKASPLSSKIEKVKEKIDEQKHR